MLNINNKFYVSIKVGGKTLNLDSVTLKSMTLQSNALFSFPTACIELSDSIRYFDTNPLLDGTTIDIQAGIDYSKLDKPLYRFRVYSVTHKESGSVVYYKINCIFNAPKYINESFKGAFNSSSASAISEIAKTCGLISDVDATTDNQVWYGAARKRYVIAKEISEASYLNPNSCYALGLTLDSKLKLKNISAINISASNNLFVQGHKVSANVVSVLDKKESTNSGLFNNLSAYKFEGIEQLTEGNYLSHDTLKLSSKSTTINVNSTLNSKLESGTVKVYPVTTGNKHSNAYQAKYQNTRIKSTYGNTLNILINQESNLDLFDAIKYVCFDNLNGQVKINNKLSGGYIISGKIIYIESGNYYEKIQITRQGYNLDTITAGDKQILGI